MKKIIMGLPIIFTLSLLAHEIDSAQKMVAGIVYSGSINAADLDRLTQQLRYDLDIATRAVYSFDSITSSGFYRLANNVSNQITISASGVMLDLNGCTVSGGTNGIVINSGLSNILIKNGTIGSVTSDGIVVNSGCTDIAFENVTVKNAIRGFNFSNVTNSSMRNCDMISNTTGVQITSGRNIVLQNCTAQVNTNAGYDLISSTTCALFDCKALSTGQGNTTAFNNLVTGFVSANGNGNIFQRCVANSTQALTTTDSSSLVAGFALRGTEMCSTIMECEAADSMTSSNGFTVPYGIVLANSLSSLTTVTTSPIGSLCPAVDWSPDGQYLAAAADQGSPFRVYSFNRSTGILVLVASALSVAELGALKTVKWSPDGQYIAVGGTLTGNALRLFSFNRTTNTLILIQSLFSSGSIASFDWSLDGQYLAVGSTVTGATNDLYVYRFNRTTYVLTQVASAISTTNVNAVSWSPDGLYLAVGGNINPSIGVVIYSFNRSSNTLTQITTVLANTVFAVQWSPDGQYLAVGGSITGDDLYIYRFNRSSGVLTLVTSAISGTDTVQSVNWSADGNYLAVGTNTVSSNNLRVYSFNRSTGTLTQLIITFSSNGVNTAVWSPDGQYIAVGGATDQGDTNDLRVLTGLQFPSKNVIMNNAVYCNSGSQIPNGVGISGSSIANMIIQNSSFNNPIYLTANFPAVYSDYQFVCNVFNQNFGDSPSQLQNIQVDYNIPIQDRINLPTDLQRIEFLAFSLFDILA